MKEEKTPAPAEGMSGGEQQSTRLLTEEQAGGTEQTTRPRAKRLGPIIGMAVCLCLAAVMFFYSAGFFFLCVFGVVAFGLRLLCTEVYARTGGRVRLFAPVAALCLGITYLPFIFVASLFLREGVLAIFSVLLFLAAFICPVAGVLTAIVSLCTNRRGGKLSLALNIVAIALPALTVGVIILLSSANVTIINLM